jgi:hypothetical protein
MLKKLKVKICIKKDMRQWLCHVSSNFLPFKEKSHSLSSQAAPFFSFAKGKKSFCKGIPLT